VECRDRPMITLFETGHEFVRGRTITLAEEHARHIRARRAAIGDATRLVDGRGHIAIGRIASADKRSVSVAIEEVKVVPKPVPLEVLVPIADRDRMLMAAEKCAELQVTAWRPVYFARSRSVSPRGEGPKFQEKVVARMRAALEQSGGAWMPEVHAELEGEHAFRSAPGQWNRLFFDASGQPFVPGVASVPTIIAVGPEGGWDTQEIALARDTGWALTSLSQATLRFETAIIAAAAVIRATQLSPRS
jgi:16S rRNA (uracil1498-N3)-methyltransferase